MLGKDFPSVGEKSADKAADKAGNQPDAERLALMMVDDMVHGRGMMTDDAMHRRRMTGGGSSATAAGGSESCPAKGYAGESRDHDLLDVLVHVTPNLSALLALTLS